MSVTINGSAGVTTNSGAVYNGIAQGTSVSASGTSVDFTGIPSWVKRVTVMIGGLSSNGSSHFLIQAGTSSGATTSGYVGAAGVAGGTNAAGATSQTTGAPVYNPSSSYAIYGSVVLTNVSGNVWCFSGAYASPGYSWFGSMGSLVTLAAALDRVRITTVNGTDTFDAGTLNILYE